MKPTFFTTEIRQKVIYLFLNTKENSAPNIAKQVNLKHWNVNKIINDYLKENKNEKN